jgi:Bacterial Ig-like domain (group 3)/Cep192 domain 4/Beta-propeller repeat
MIRFLLLLTLSCACCAQPVVVNPNSAIPPQHASRATSSTAYGELPLVFETNRGQIDPAIKFAARGRNYTVGLTASGTLLAKVEPPANAKAEPQMKNSSLLRLRIAGGNPNPQIDALEEQGGKVNYYLGSAPGSWLTGIPLYAKVRYRGIYPGIDVVHYGNQGRLEHDFIVHPGADPRLIRMKISGANSVSLDRSGTINLKTASGAMTLEPPIAYQEANGVREVVAASYVLEQKGLVGFKLGAYDLSKAVIIDPVLAYSTYLTGSNRTEPKGIKVDGSGAAYILGDTFAINFPVVNAFQSTNHGNTDVFLTKLNPEGTAIVFSTYFGGLGFDEAGGIALDADGNAYITGVASSANFPTTPGAFQETCSPVFCHTPFVAKFTPDGMLSYSTLLGPSNGVGRAIAVDGSGNAYVTGLVASTDLPIVNAFQPTFGGNGASANAFVQKLNPSGSGFFYSTYFGSGGSNASTIGRGIAVDGAGAAYVTGTLQSASIPTKNAAQLAASTAFLTKFAPDGTDLEYSTYLGGTGTNDANAVAVDPAGRAFVVGTTDSCDFPLSTSALSVTCGGNRVFVLKLNPSGSAFEFATFVGQGNAAGLGLDSAGNANVAGTTAAPTFPVSSPIQGTLQQGPSSINSDGFITKLSGSGQLLFSTYFGGAGTEDALSAIAVGPSGEILVVGSTSGGHFFPMDFPLLKPIQSTAPCCGLDVAVVAKIDPVSNTGISLSPLESPLIGLRNVSSSTLLINSIVPSANFVKGGTCGAALGAGDTCWLFLQGAADGLVRGTVTIASNAPGSPHAFAIAKSPFGDSPGPVLRISPTVLLFPAQFIGTSSTQPITVTNVSLAPAVISSIGVNAPFSQTNNCGSSLAPSASCTISVAFQPASEGSAFGNVQIDHGFLDTIFVAGSGSSRRLVAGVSNIRFGEQFVDAPPLPRIVEWTNISANSVMLPNPNVTGLFSFDMPCSSLAPRESCRIAIAFHPNRNGAQTGTLTLPGIGGDPAQVITLDGTGVLRSDIAVSPLELPFFTVSIGQSTSASVTLTNLTPFTRNITSVTIAGDYTQSNNCGSALGPNASCVITVAFTPTAEGPRSGTLSINHSGKGSPQLVSLGGSGRTPLVLSPSEILFEAQPLGTTSVFHFLSVGNGTGFSSAITLRPPPFVITGDFQIAQDPCPNVLDRFMGCALQLTFKPTSVGLRTGTLTITASDSAVPHVIPLRGIGAGTGSDAARFTLTSSPARVTLGQSISFTAALTPLVGQIVPTGSIVFQDGTKVLGSASLSNGTASVAAILSGVGTHLVNAIYAGDNNFLPHISSMITIVIDKAASGISLSASPNPSITGQPATLTATATSNAGVATSGTVTFYDGGIPIGTTLVGNAGVAVLTTSDFIPGSHSLRAVYHGDANHFPSTSATIPHLVTAVGTVPSTAALTVEGPVLVLFRQRLQLSVAVSSGGGMPSGTVLFFDGEATIGSVQLDNLGRATLTLNGLPAGVRQIRAVYLGDATFAPSSSSVVTVNRSPRPR